jgi:hypothetical protein
VEVPAVLAEQLQTVGDRLSCTAKDPRGLAVRNLRDKGADQIVDELRLLEAEVDAKSLGREGAVALET